jgi:2'-5' RNA ligase
VKRLFLGVALPYAAQHALTAGLDAHFSGQRLPGVLVPPANWHITVRFLGDVSDGQQDRLSFALSDISMGDSFDVTLEGLGAFPNARFASVLWAGVGRGEERLEALAATVDERLTIAGFDVNERPYVPHLSLARIRPKVDVWSWLEVEARLRVKWSVSGLTLFETRFEGGQIRYEPIEIFELG